MKNEAEYNVCFNPSFAGYGWKRGRLENIATPEKSVSILLLLDMVGKAVGAALPGVWDIGFNPSFAGYGWKRSFFPDCVGRASDVSILLLLDMVGKAAAISRALAFCSLCFNPSFAGYGWKRGITESPDFK